MSAASIPSGADDLEAIIEEGDKLTADKQENSEALQGKEEEMPGDDEKVIQTMKVWAIAEMVKHGVKITQTQSKATMGVIPKACSHTSEIHLPSM